MSNIVPSRALLVNENVIDFICEHNNNVHIILSNMYPSIRFLNVGEMIFLRSEIEIFDAKVLQKGTITLDKNTKAVFIILKIYDRHIIGAVDALGF